MPEDERQQKKWSVAYSPCPNDTFIFCALAQRADVQVSLHDVETLNQMAFDGVFDVTKLSFHAWLYLQDRYQLLQVGAALGRGCGPLVIRRRDDARPLGAASVVAVPGEYTTAHLLLRLWRPEIDHRVFMPFDQIMDAVESGAVDAGVIIHEGRFVFESRGFVCVVDLGDWWERETGLPIPLGCIAAKRELGAERIARFESMLAESVRAAFSDRASTRPYVKRYAQELEDDVMDRHINTYVNAFTVDLGEEGHAAIERLRQMAVKLG